MSEKLPMEKYLWFDEFCARLIAWEREKKHGHYAELTVWTDGAIPTVEL